jgi:hypothetical protein
LDGKYAAPTRNDDAEWAKPPGERLTVARGIEVGHIFNFGTKYTEAHGRVVNGPDGDDVHPHGLLRHRRVTPGRRIIEASHDENGIVWPESVAPFGRPDQPEDRRRGCDGACETSVCGARRRRRRCPLLRRPDERAGAKFADMDLIGLPWQVVVGPRGVRQRRRRSEEPQDRRPEGRNGSRTRSPRSSGWSPGAICAAAQGGAVSIVTIISLVGVTLGVATLIIVMAVMNGFRAELLDRILGLNGHMVISPIDSPLTDYDAVSARVAGIPGVTMVMPIVEGQALATGNAGAGSGVLVRGMCAARISSSSIRFPRTSRKAPSRPT